MLVCPEERRCGLVIWASSWEVWERTASPLQSASEKGVILQGLLSARVRPKRARVQRVVVVAVKCMVVV